MARVNIVKKVKADGTWKLLSVPRNAKGNYDWNADLKTFRSTYATRMLRAGSDVRTVQHWMGHKSLKTTMRYLVPASDIHGKLDQVTIPGLKSKDTPRKRVRRETKGPAETIAV